MRETRGLEELPSLKARSRGFRLLVGSLHLHIGRPLPWAASPLVASSADGDTPQHVPPAAFGARIGFDS